jgi:hypothetical protein
MRLLMDHSSPNRQNAGQRWYYHAREADRTPSVIFVRRQWAERYGFVPLTEDEAAAAVADGVVSAGTPDQSAAGPSAADDTDLHRLDTELRRLAAWQQAIDHRLARLGEEHARLAGYVESLTIEEPPPQQPQSDALAPPTHQEQLPPLPAAGPDAGWVKRITARIDAGDEAVPTDQPMAPPPTTQVVVTREEKVFADSEYGKAEIRYQVALQAINGSTYAKQLMANAAERRGVGVLDLANAIIEERRSTEQRVMSEY